MSYYKQGLAVGAASIKVGSETPISPTTTVLAVAMVGVVAFLGFRKKPSYQGPDTRDIEARIKSRGLDPNKYGFGRG